MPVDRISFELQRRLNQHYEDVRSVVSSPVVLGAGMTMPLEREGLLVLEAPFRAASFPYKDTFHAHAVLTSARGHRVAAVRLALTPWSSEATAMSLRPRSTHPDRWTSRHVRHYFALAHTCADTMARVLAEEALQRAATAEIATRIDPRSVPKIP